MKKLIFFFICLIIPYSVYGIGASSYIVMDMNSGRVMEGKNVDNQRLIASISKIMTCIVAIEYGDIEGKVKIGDEVIKSYGSGIYVGIGEELTLDDLLYGLMLRSGNDAALAIAHNVGGSLENFVFLMNEMASKIGMNNTVFVNPSGLEENDGSGNKSTVYDMALLTQYAMKNEHYRRIVGTENIIVKSSMKTYKWFNKNKLLSSYEYCTGGKTGYTRVANSTLVTYAEKDGLVLCVVVMNANSPDHWTDTNKLIDYCFNNYQALNISEHEASIAETNQLSKGILNTYGEFVTLNKDAYIVLPNTAEFKDAIFERDDVTEDANTIAALKYSYGGREVGNVEIVATNATVEDLYFSKKDTETAEKESNVVIIKPVILIAGGISVGVLLILILAIKYVYDNYYFMRHNREVKKAERERFKIVKVRKRRRGWRGRR